MYFKDLSLIEPLLRALEAVGYEQPTPIQQQAIPIVLSKSDLLGCAQTGTGKTAAFALPMLQLLSERPRTEGKTPIRALILTPTRELAIQIAESFNDYGKFLKIRNLVIFGGVNQNPQTDALRRGTEVLIATPGRLLDLMNQGFVHLKDIEIFVLDEADRMLDMGFIEDIELIVSRTPATRQTLLFSATLDGMVGNIARRITTDPLRIQIAGASSRHENIEQRVHFVDDLLHKNRLLDHLLRDTAIDQAVVFTATKRDADQIADRLSIAGFAAAALHGDMHQGARNRTLNALRSGQLRVLVATDVAARGIDVPGITHVFNYDLPKFAEDYVHRIGRTGRAGRNGMAISLVNHAEGVHVKRIERLTKQTIPVDVIAGFEPKKTASTRSRPGWKPGDGRGKPAKPGKPGQRTFAKPGAPGKDGGYRGQRDSRSAEGRRG